MNLQEIFKDFPELLENEAVKNLIQHVQRNHKRSVEICKRHQKFYDAVFDKYMYSEIILINGKSAKETLNEIHQLILEF